MKRLEFVGLGAMGAPMARRIATAGFSLGVFDVVTHRARPLLDLGAEGSDSPGRWSRGPLRPS